MAIILYDIPSATPENSWSMHLWRARFSLNFKGIPYKTEWVEYPDIEPHAKKHGIPPTSNLRADGSPGPYYSLPAIYDPSTGVYISDSLKIAEYLDKTYPNTPPLLSDNIPLALQTAFTDAFCSNLSALWTFFVPAIYSRLNPPSQVYFRNTREILFGKKIEELAPTGEDAIAQWSNFESAFGNVDAWYAKNDEKGPFLLGKTPSWGDLIVASALICMEIIWGEDSQQWKDISSWHGGRWKNLLETLQEYQTIV